MTTADTAPRRAEPTTPGVDPAPTAVLVESISVGSHGEVARRLADHLTQAGWTARATWHEARAHNDSWTEHAVVLSHVAGEVPALWTTLQDDAMFARPDSASTDQLLERLEQLGAPSPAAVAAFAELLHQLRCPVDHSHADPACTWDPEAHGGDDGTTDWSAPAHADFAQRSRRLLQDGARAGLDPAQLRAALEVLG